MNDDRDHYEDFYANKLWRLLPAIYRTLDTDQFDSNGPLRELVNRIGAQAAIVRRSIDRMWEDQSIETCDDWVIPYIGDLLATSLVSGIDTRTMRRDVAKTIYYRRRKGTLSVLEEVAFDITGWNARVVEFSRRLGRTRHGLDPPIGRPSIADPDAALLQQALTLRGPLTQTGAGGLADLRKPAGASRAGSAFDEFSHTADFRAGQGKIGWYGIPRLGVFLWRIQSFGVRATTPVQSTVCPGQFTFDPTGRETTLFAAARPATSGNWTSPEEWQLPTPLTPPLLEPALGVTPAYPLYTVQDDESLSPNSLGIFQATAVPGQFELVAASALTASRTRGADATFSGAPASAPLPAFLIDPTRGRLIALDHSPPGDLRLTYHYGFSSTIGAGPYDRRLGSSSTGTPDPQEPPIAGGGKALSGSRALPKSGTVTIDDSLTYTAMDDVTIEGCLTIRAGNSQRPVIRLAPSTVDATKIRFNGSVSPAGNCLVVDGLFFTGMDLVLSGEFDCVTITCCTLDPGTRAPLKTAPGAAASAASTFATSADQRALVPCRLWIEGKVGALTIARSITGPIRTRSSGRVNTLSVTDSIIQAIPTAGSGTLEPGDVKDSEGLERQLRTERNPIASYLRGLSPALQQLVTGPGSMSIPFSRPGLEALYGAMNGLIVGPSLYREDVFKSVLKSAETLRLLNVQGLGFSAPVTALNRLLLEDAFPVELADAAIALSDGHVELLRSTVIGRVVVHRLDASNCILTDLAQVDDAQHGCVRFTAWAENSLLPRQYESLQISQGAQLFASTDFGQHAYGQLLPTVDECIIQPSGATISAGAENGAEMGAFARELNPVKEAGLLLKFQENMPVGLVPVLIHVT
jgi:hypothetical protein